MARKINLIIINIVSHIITFICMSEEVPVVKGYGALRDSLNVSESVLSYLIESVCGDLQMYQDKLSADWMSACQENILSSEEKVSANPPEVQVQCQFAESVRYSLSPATSATDWRLVLLVPDDTSAIDINYNLMGRTEHFGTIATMQPFNYTFWSADLKSNGDHSLWRQGSHIIPWNATGDVVAKHYKVDVNMVHEEVDGDSRVKATFRWNNSDVDDVCFDVMTSCKGSVLTNRIWPNENRMWEVNNLPLNHSCEVQVMGKHGTTSKKFHTPSSDELDASIELDIVRNVSVIASEAADGGWDVLVQWSQPQRSPQSYNVTLRSEHVTRTAVLLGNATNVTIHDDVEDKGYYYVSIVAMMGRTGIHTSRRAKFPEKYRSNSAAWGASVLALSMIATLFAVLCWRKSRAAKRKRFSDYIDCDVIPIKDGTMETIDIEASGTEDNWEVRSERLLLHEVIGEGAFGVVRRGILSPGGKEVAVKMLKDFPTLEEIRSFHAEMELMKSVGSHPHVVSLVGCCSGRRPLIVVEYCSRGDLLSYLRCFWDVMMSKRNAKYYNNNIETDYRNDLFKCKFQKEQSKLVVNKLYDLQGMCDTELTSRDLLSFCRQIAMGMEFLESNRVVHRDLAARNILVSKDRTLKIADFGLSRDVYEENQYKQKGNGKMPVKWMALESLTRRIYTTQSDVWSFGVVLWEIVTVGGAPYPGVPAARLLRLLRAGYRMPRPINCSKQLYELMLACWSAQPRARPTFSELHAQLDALLNSACAQEYLSLELDTEDPRPNHAYPQQPSHQKYIHMIKEKLGWNRGENYERPLRPPLANHYSSPPAALASPMPA